jgi:hypothetical protein
MFYNGPFGHIEYKVDSRVPKRIRRPAPVRR